jgi:UDP-N-acetylglucosamine--N-acetylmuramyl-(pentapeptide) pyrophosphoryl-undecaprenol N-acetylglucosamine transferase
MNTGPVLIMAGGTGGHIFPGLAVARALQAQNVPVAWLGAEGGLEGKLVREAGIPLVTLPITGLRGKGLMALLRAPWQLWRALRLARAALRATAPRCVVSFGGYAAGPGGLAAYLARLPLLVHEQNRIPGFTNRILARLARRVLVGFPDAFGTRRGIEAVGNPVRAEIAALAPPDQRLAGRSGPIRILVLGGSQGARALNRAVPLALAALPAELCYEVLHQTGAKLHDEAWSRYAEAGVKARTEPFIADMAGAYAWADLVICRAGALTLAELCAVGIASILVPFPFAVDDHQTRNAEFLVGRGGALLLSEGDALAARLSQRLSELLPDRARLMAMALAARAEAKPDAALRIAALCLAEAAA